MSSLPRKLNQDDKNSSNLTGTYAAFAVAVAEIIIHFLPVSTQKIEAQITVVLVVLIGLTITGFAGLLAYIAYLVR